MIFHLSLSLFLSHIVIFYQSYFISVCLKLLYKWRLYSCTGNFVEVTTWRSFQRGWWKCDIFSCNAALSAGVCLGRDLWETERDANDCYSVNEASEWWQLKRLINRNTCAWLTVESLCFYSWTRPAKWATLVQTSASRSGILLFMFTLLNHWCGARRGSNFFSCKSSRPFYCWSLVISGWGNLKRKIKSAVPRPRWRVCATNHARNRNLVQFGTGADTLRQMALSLFSYWQQKC